MATLFLMYDTAAGRFIGASRAGKFISGVAEVVIRPGEVSVRDYQGNDLLADQPKSVESGPDQSRAAADIAAAFGVGTTPADADGDKQIDGFGAWDRGAHRVSLPDTVTETEFVRITGLVAKSLYRRFGALHGTEEDFAQEVVVWALQAMPKYDTSRPLGLDKVSDEHESRMKADPTVESDDAHQELRDLIDARLPVAIRSDYLMMLAGASHLVSIPRRRVVQREVAAILEEAGVEVDFDSLVDKPLPRKEKGRVSAP